MNPPEVQVKSGVEELEMGKCDLIIRMELLSNHDVQIRSKERVITVTSPDGQQVQMQGQN